MLFKGFRGVVGVACLWMLLGCGRVSAITIGPGPVIGTNKNPNVPYTGGGVWFQEFQDWKASDLRALDTNADNYSIPDGSDTSRDLVAFYSHDDGTNFYFRMDFFDLGYNVETWGLDVYVAIDCAPGGNSTLPDNIETQTDHPWEAVVAVYDQTYRSLYGVSGLLNTNLYLGSYWRSDLDGVEFGIKRSLLTDRGWDGVSPFHLQAYTCKDNPGGNNEIPNGSDIVDNIGTLTATRAAGTGRLEGGVLSSSTTGRAKYAVIAHANQSVATKGGTQGHIFTDRSDVGKLPRLHPSD
jgi:hypothetical protein